MASNDHLASSSSTNSSSSKQAKFKLLSSNTTPGSVISDHFVPNLTPTTCQQVFTNDFFEELVDKYSLPFNTNDLEQLNLNQKLEEIRNYLRNEIYKQYKLQEGAEKMRSATTDKKRLNNLLSMIKESNLKIDELNQELNELNSYIVITQSESSLVLDTLNSKFIFITK